MENEKTKTEEKTGKIDCHVHLFRDEGLSGWLIPTLKMYNNDKIDPMDPTMPTMRYILETLLTFSERLVVEDPLLAQDRIPLYAHWVNATAELLRAKKDEVKRAVLLSMDSAEPYGFGLFTATNEEVRKMVRAFSEIFLCAISINPKREDAVKLLEKELAETAELYEERGLDYRLAVKLHPISMQFDPANISDDFFVVMNDFGVVLDVHTGPFQSMRLGKDVLDAVDPARWERAAAKYRSITIILEHMGTPDALMEAFYMREGIALPKYFDNAVRLVLGYENVYGTIAGLIYDGAGTEGLFNTDVHGRDYTPRSRGAFEKIKADERIQKKIVGGSDYPIVKGIQHQRARQIAELGFDPYTQTVKIFKKPAQIRANNREANKERQRRMKAPVR